MSRRVNNSDNHPVAGKKTVFYTEKHGLPVPKKQDQREEEEIFDTSHIFGWNNPKESLKKEDKREYGPNKKTENSND